MLWQCTKANLCSVLLAAWVSRDRDNCLWIPWISSNKSFFSFALFCFSRFVVGFFVLFVFFFLKPPSWIGRKKGNWAQVKKGDVQSRSHAERWIVGDGRERREKKYFTPSPSCPLSLLRFPRWCKREIIRRSLAKKRQANKCEDSLFVKSVVKVKRLQQFLSCQMCT